jgi:hypothetical protein
MNTKKLTLDSVLARLQKENEIREITNAGAVRGGAAVIKSMCHPGPVTIA